MSLVPFVHLDASLADAEAGDERPLTPDEVHHLSTVLRLGPGACVEVSDGQGRSAAGELVGRAVRLRETPIEHGRARPSIEVAQALPKGRKLDEVVRQLTELGVDAVRPVTTQRCLVRLDGEKARRATTRWRAVARAACEQARRGFRPDIADPRPFSELVDLAGTEDTVVLVAQPGAASFRSRLDEAAAAEWVVVVIGPEGGLTSDEVAALAAAGARPVGLGPTTLRTEHAAAAAVAALACALGRWD